MLAVEPVPQPLDQKLAQGVNLLRCDREACGHRVAAAIDQQARLARRDHRRPQRRARHRAAGALADPVG